MEINGKIILLFGSLSEKNGLKHSFFFIPSKPQNLKTLVSYHDGGKQWTKLNIKENTHNALFISPSQINMDWRFPICRFKFFWALRLSDALH
jgi:hypothetical protein